MGAKLCDESDLEHITLAYEGGDMTLRFREYSQTLKLFKKVDAYSEHNVVISSSAWFEMEQTIKRYEYRYYVMLSNGEFMSIDDPTRENEFNEECCIVKISNEDYIEKSMPFGLLLLICLALLSSTLLPCRSLLMCLHLLC
jgi:hypothetical protein